MQAAVTSRIETVADTPARASALPWYCLAVVFGATCIPVGALWDISWHSTIGRDTFWTPAHITIHLGGLVPGFDLVVVATGALIVDGVGPEKSVRSVTAEGLAAQFAVNAVGPTLVMKHALRLLPRDRVSKLAVLSARVGSIGDNGLGGWYGYRAAKAALNQLVRTASVEAKRTHPYSVFVALHPGTVETGLAPSLRAGHPSVSPEVAAGNLLRVLEGLGPEQSGGFYDWKGEVVPW